MLLVACEKSNDHSILRATDSETSTEPPQELFNPNEPVIFGKRIENPYSVENMRAAFNSLSAETRGDLSADDVVITTHKYLKFIFRNDEQYDIINRDASITLFFYPIDLEIERSGYYEDEGSEDGIRIRYASISVDKMELVNSCGVEFVTLANMFMPDEDGYREAGFATRVGAVLTAEQIDLLIEKSIRLTGNENRLSTSQGITRASVRPSGTIKIETGRSTSVQGAIGLQGVEIRAVRLLKVSKGFTNASGYYLCDKAFSNNWSYELSFERYDFDINDGRNGKFCYINKATMSLWSFTITASAGKGYYIATIFRAAHHYYYEDIKGLRRPPQNSFWKTQMKIAAMYESDPNSNGSTMMARRFLGMGNAIHIYNPNRETEEIYNTVIHELAHSSHWDLSKSDYNRTDLDAGRVVESWAVGVADVLTKMKYPSYKGRYYGNDQLYTQIVVDMIDTEADASTNYGYNIAGGDNVSGYTIRQIEDCLLGARSFDTWRANIYNRYPGNGTRGNLQKLFNSWYR
jgi:hypothetical protein